jgi:hypothetical protein
MSAAHILEIKMFVVLRMCLRVRTIWITVQLPTNETTNETTPSIVSPICMSKISGIVLVFPEKHKETSHESLTDSMTWCALVVTQHWKHGRRKRNKLPSQVALSKSLDSFKGAISMIY